MIDQVPAGKVATYGQIAKLAGIPKNSRQVGTVLRSIPHGIEIPWYRIVNSKGEISTRGNPDSESYQRIKLESENVEFDRSGRINMRKHQWNP